MLRDVSRFLSRHWQGRIALVPTLLFTLLGLRLGLDWLTGQRPLDWPLWVFGALTALGAVVLLWQIVGSLRAVNTRGDAAWLGTGLTAAGIALLLFINQELNGYAARAAIPASIPPTLPLPVVDNAMQLSGPLDWSLYARFCATLHHHPDLTRIDIKGDGGYVPVARAMALRIRERGLDTRASGLCASACTLVFMGGARRTLGEGGALGFHGYDLRRADPLQTTREEEARDRAWLEQRGVAPEFAGRVFETPQSTLWRPDAAHLSAAGVLADRAGNSPRPDRQACGAFGG